MKAIKEERRIIISGGGTGGHIFPAISIANALIRLAPDVKILFVGALGKMEMEKIPAAGYKIIGLDIQGFNRSSIFKNLMLPIKLIKSIYKANTILRDFEPQIVIGVGGYASGPLLLAAGRRNVPYLIQEQNSYAGITNKRLGKKARKICVAFDHMERFFPAEKILLTGNPIRKEMVDIENKREEGLKHFRLSNDRRTILITGGSLGARTLNDSVMNNLEKMSKANVQLIWQCGNFYFEKLDQDLEEQYRDRIVLKPFLQRMDLAYAAADLIISRAGAGTIAELCVIAKPIILVPSPNVAEDHQTSNAKALVDKQAALLVKDQEAQEKLIETAIDLLNNKERCDVLSKNSKKLAILDADERIAHEVLALTEEGL